MSYPRVRVPALLAALTLTLGLIVAIVAAEPLASASGPVRQCDPAGVCLNFWAGGEALSAYHGAAVNDAISIQSIPGTGNFQLRDNTHLGTSCVGDNGNSSSAARAGGGLDCNSTQTGGGGGWGTRFQRVPSALCPAGFYVYWSYHWQAYLGFGNSNGSPVFLNTSGTCLRQLS